MIFFRSKKNHAPTIIFILNLGKLLAKPLGASRQLFFVTDHTIKCL